MFSNLKGDFRTYQGDITRQGFWVMCVYRLGRWRYTIPWRLVRLPFSLLYKILFKIIQILTGVELPCEAEVGPGFRIDHFGDIIISGYARFGADCVVRNGVTVGLKNVDEIAAPVVGNNVSFGAGCKVLGPIRIGDNVDIGANAVVIRDVPSNHIAVGIPARIIPKSGAVGGPQ